MIYLDMDVAAEREVEREPAVWAIRSNVFLGNVLRS
jgi:hypothetical protein